MQAPNYALRDAERLMPLLRAIRREIRERTLAVTKIEQLLETLSKNRRAHRDLMGRLESELSTQRRELHRLLMVHSSASLKPRCGQPGSLSAARQLSCPRCGRQGLSTPAGRGFSSFLRGPCTT